MDTALTLPAETRLDVTALTEALVRHDRLSAKDLLRLRGMRQTTIHPLVLIAEQKLADPSLGGTLWDMPSLLQFLSEQTNQPVVEIDPLKVDVKAVAEVMSEAFAERHRILAVAVSGDEVTIASAEPWVAAWEKDLEHVIRRPIKRVLADPRDISRYTREFYAMARSVEGALHRSQGGSDLSNLEAMVQLGGGEPDANDQHIVRVVDWLLQYAFEQRASDIHVEPRRDVGNVRFRIDGVLHKVYELPSAVAAAVTSRLKILARLDVAEKRRPQDGRLKTRSPRRR